MRYVFSTLTLLGSLVVAVVSVNAAEVVTRTYKDGSYNYTCIKDKIEYCGNWNVYTPLVKK